MTTTTTASNIPPLEELLGGEETQLNVDVERKGVQDMMDALTAVGPEISGVLVDICCDRKGLEEAEKEYRRKK